MTESEIQARILLAIGALPGVRVFRNTVGTGWHGEIVHKDKNTITLANPRPVTFGLATHSPDLVGWRTRLITPDLIGETIAQFVGVEVKTARGTASDGQRNFLRVLRESGACAGVARSPDDARRIVCDL